eukprot:GHVT01041945.1.p1 GENE.GHVT01041945.1~~GHVT01041945.1.p1  ORF type:complete len:220 (+),score=9.38 GHVT01041945.1:331-990(+)
MASPSTDPHPSPHAPTSRRLMYRGGSGKVTEESKGSIAGSASNPDAQQIEPPGEPVDSGVSSSSAPMIKFNPMDSGQHTNLKEDPELLRIARAYLLIANKLRCYDFSDKTGSHMEPQELMYCIALNMRFKCLVTESDKNGYICDHEAHRHRVGHQTEEEALLSKFDAKLWPQVKNYVQSIAEKAAEKKRESRKRVPGYHRRSEARKKLPGVYRQNRRRQ